MYNLTPITGNRSSSIDANKAHLNLVEQFIKPEINNHKVLRYKVTAIYGVHPTRSFQTTLINRIGTPQEAADDKKKLSIMNYEQYNLCRGLSTDWAILKRNEGGAWVDDVVKSPLSVLNILPDGDFEFNND
jgi:hypothetical protein